jgi:hypothetical protein
MDLNIDAYEACCLWDAEERDNEVSAGGRKQCGGLSEGSSDCDIWHSFLLCSLHVAAENWGETRRRLDDASLLTYATGNGQELK